MAVPDGVSIETADVELDKVLRPLAGDGLYRNNVFRITGLGADASPTQVRRRRDEIAMAVRLGIPAPTSATDLPLPPETDEEALRPAFEALRNPVIRLTHELLWLWPEKRGQERDELAERHNEAVRAHCAAVEAECVSTASADELDALWTRSLSGWSAALTSGEMWERGKARADELDDPRLTKLTVRRLRERLPQHVVGVNVALAARAANDGDEATAKRHMRLLRSSPFAATTVCTAAREVARTAERRIQSACEVAKQSTGSGQGIESARTLLADVDSPLLVVSLLLGADDPLTLALYDNVAGTVNHCAVDHYNKHDQGHLVLPLLRRAQDLVSDETMLDLIEENLGVVGRGVLLGADLGALRKEGRVDKVAVRLRAWRRWTRSAARKQHLDAMLSDPRALASPVAKVPSLGCFFVLGSHLYGGRDVRVEDVAESKPLRYTSVKTRFLTFLWFPLIPMSAYITGWDAAQGKLYGGKVPLGPVARWYRLLVLVALPCLVVWPVVGMAVALAMAAGLVVFTAMCLGLRELRLVAWVRDREAAL